jgi:hypothetical protein
MTPSAQRIIRILTEFGWLNQADPSHQMLWYFKCRASEEAQSFKAMGTLVDLATQTYAVPPAKIGSILPGFTALLTGPHFAGVAVRAVARLKGLMASTWLATGPASRVRIFAMDGVIASRAGASALSRREKRTSWKARVTLSAECFAELQ